MRMHRILDKSPLARLIVVALNSAGYQAYVVGGAVRDMFLDREPKDIDIATDMPAKEMHRLRFPDTLFESMGMKPAEVSFKPVGVEFGVGAFAMNGEVIEVANFRLDLAFDGRHRGVTVGVAKTIEEDLVRRDFSMNAMALNPLEEDDEKALVDPFGGRESIRRGIIDTPGSPEKSFEQDPLRVLRAVRFMARFGFSLAPELFDAARKRLVRQRFLLLSAERIRDEVLKILEVEDGAAVARAFTVMQEMRVLELFMPELSSLAGWPFMKEHHTEDPFGHTLLALSTTARNLVLRLAVLGHDFGKRFTLDPFTFATPGHARTSRELVAAMMRRLKMPVAIWAQVAHLVDSHMDHLEDGRPYRRLKRAGFLQFGIEHLDLAEGLRKADLRGKATVDSGKLVKTEMLFAELKDLATNHSVMSVKDLPVKGHDVMRVTGMKPGPQVGSVLKDLLVRVVNGDLVCDRRHLMTVVEVEHERDKLPFD